MLRLIWAFIYSIILWILLNLLFFEGKLPLDTFFRYLGGGMLLLIVVFVTLLWWEGRNR